jgi:hypothetical protein
LISVLFGGLGYLLFFTLQWINGYEPEDDKHMKVGVVLVSPSVNAVHFSWRDSKRKWIFIKFKVAIKEIWLYYYRVAQITRKSLSESFFRN